MHNRTTNEMLQEAYEAGRRQALNEQGSFSGPGRMSMSSSMGGGGMPGRAGSGNYMPGGIEPMGPDWWKDRPVPKEYWDDFFKRYGGGFPADGGPGMVGDWGYWDGNQLWLLWSGMPQGGIGSGM